MSRYPSLMPTAVGPDGSEARQPKPSLADRVRNFALKPVDPDAPPRQQKGAYELSGEELVQEEKRANDKERAIGLLAGPVATLIAFFVVHEKVVDDPPAHLANGAVNKLHVALSTYSWLFLVLIVLSFGITGMALWRKRIPLGIFTALYGLSVFNLGYIGFGVPFVMVAAWYLVRAYRLHRNVKESAASEGPSTRTAPPPSSKRFTPPSSSQKRLPAGKPRRERGGG